jgi:hypothetical protein
VSRLTDLIAQAKAKDAQMGADLEREFRALSSRLPFGLNFERHRPEAVELPLRPIRKGDKVRVLPERGSTKKGDHRLWLVKKIGKEGNRKMAELELPDDVEPQTQTVPLDDLIVIAEFKDTIYPGLVSTGNRTLSLGNLGKIEVPMPPLAVQQTFDHLQADVAALKAKHTAIRQANAALLPATLERVFGERRFDLA